MARSLGDALLVAVVAAILAAPAALAQADTNYALQVDAAKAAMRADPSGPMAALLVVAGGVVLWARPQHAS